MVLASNRKIYMDYEVLDTYVAGMQLFGYEVKSARSGKVILEGSQIILSAGIVQIVGMQISPIQPNNTPDTYKSDRTRSLLLKKGEIEDLYKAKDSKLVIIPKSVFLSHNLIKIEIAICKRLKKADKRNKIREKDFKNTAN